MKYGFFSLLLISVVCLAACNMPLKAIETPQPMPTLAPTKVPPTPAPTDIPPAPEPTDIPAPVHKDIPGSPVGKLFQTVHDQVNDKTAPQKQAFGGDDFRNGKYERPFDRDMNYMPETDLVNVKLNRADPLWIYILMTVKKPFIEGAGGNTNFMVEIDTDLDSRGDILIMSGTPKSTTWSTETVKVYTAPDRNVGGELVVRPDPVLSEGRGFYEEIFNDGLGEDPDLAWSRLSKSDTSVMEIAFKNTLTGGEEGKFVWLPWADSGMQNSSLFDYNDHFTFAMAGYPVKDDPQNYPIKDLWGVDNTCRVASGFEYQGTLPGMCPEAQPPEPESPEPGCVWVCRGSPGMTHMVCGCQ